MNHPYTHTNGHKHKKIIVKDNYQYISNHTTTTTTHTHTHTQISRYTFTHTQRKK